MNYAYLLRGAIGTVLLCLALNCYVDERRDLGSIFAALFVTLISYRGDQS